MTRPRCHCGWLLSTDEAGFACLRCGRVYDSTSTLPACRHSRIKRGEDGAVECLECCMRWREVDS